MADKRELALFEIYHSHYSRINRYIRAKVTDSWVADDLTQDTFVRAFKNLSQLKNKDRLSGWLTRIAGNICTDHFRKKNIEPQPHADAEKQPDVRKPASTHTVLEGKQMSSCVHEKLSLLPEGQREVLWLFDVLGLTQKEIAGALRISVDNVKVRLHRARKGLRSILQQHCQFEKDGRNVLVCEPKPGVAPDNGRTGGRTC